MSLSDLNDQLDSKIVNAEQQIESLDAEIQRKTDEQNDYKGMMDNIDSQIRSYTIDSTTSDINFLHTFGVYYPGNIDSTSDMTSWVVFTYILDNQDSTSDNDVVYGFPSGYDSSGSGSSCYTGTQKYFYTTGNKTSLFTPGSVKVSQCVDSTTIVYITISCVEYWNTYTVVRCIETSGQVGQTSNNFISPLSILNQNFYYQGGPNWSSLPQERKDKIIKLSLDFFYAHDNIFLPIGLTGTYGTKDTIENLQLGKEVQTKNKEKLEGGLTTFGDYI